MSNDTEKNLVAGRMAMKIQEKAEQSGPAQQFPAIPLDEIKGMLSITEKEYFGQAMLLSMGIYGKNPYELYSKISLGASLGLSSHQSISLITFISGRPYLEYKAELFLAAKHGYKLAFKGDETSATVTVSKNNAELGSVTFSIDEAKRFPSFIKGVWGVSPKDMLISKAVHRAIARYAPEVTGGIAPVDEAEAALSMLDENDMITLEPVAEAPKETASSLVSKILDNNQ